MIGRALAVWLAIMGLETLHGLARVLFLEPLVGDFRARQIAVFTGAALTLAVAYLSASWMRGTGTRSLLFVGLFWVALTLVFEIALGGLIFGLSWERIWSDYDLPRAG